MSSLFRSVPAFLPMQYYTSLAVFLFGAITLIVPSGYSLGAGLLLLGSVVLILNRQHVALGRDDWCIIAVMLAYALIWMTESLIDGQGTSGLDKPSRFLFALPAMLLLMTYPPRQAALWSGAAVGALSSGGWASWQKLVEGEWRAGGFTYVIQFGNISMLLGILCLAGLGWAVVQARAKWWVTFLLLGALGGILGSLFSGSRGGWVGIPFIMLVLYRGYGRDLPTKFKLGVIAIVLVGAGSVYALPQTGVQERSKEAFSDVSRYLSGESQTSSVGARFEMWKGALHLIQEKPLVGWGSNGYHEAMLELSEQGVVNRYVAQRYDHAHNEFIDATAKRGVIGLMALLALYLVPMTLFARQIHAANLEVRALAVAGVLLPVAYIDFGLTQTLMEHNSGVMVYAFWLVVLWAQFRVTKRNNQR
ncbi:O-antigen ligase family protein [Halomonas korlensis]|uniref:O-antigen ligase n=1 Tax=Halomonas korlensis TaxID=463301 RepID=A0A1I7G421_9GAMM|nr:O-antigen ligase family protein [Halomonas korlensis]SFU43217.1 O-antigen ligase [Halomonas korlensis]